MSVERHGRGAILAIGDRAIWVLAAGIVVLALAGAAVIVSVDLRLVYPGDETFGALFALNGEMNVPTWYSSMLLLVAAGLLVVIAGFTRLESRLAFRRWASLAVIFAFLSLDEVASIHERYLARLSPLPKDGIVFYAWVVPGTLLVLLVVVLYRRFVFGLPAPVRRVAIAAAALYVGGALGLEAIEGVLAARGTAEGTFPYDPIAGTEEVLEMIGALVFSVALIRYIRLRHPGARLTFDRSSE